MRLAISDEHQGPKAAIARVLACPWQRCTVHFVRNMHGHCRRDERGLVSAALREIFDAPDATAAHERFGAVLERFRPTVPKVAELMEDVEEDLLAFYRFPAPTGRRCARPTPWSESTARSGAAPTSSESSPTTHPPFGSPARC